MKKIVLLVLCIGLSATIYAQTPSWEWAETESSAGGYYYFDTHGILAAPSGHIYVGGRFSGTMTLNGATGSSSATYSEPFSAKMDSSGHFSWVTAHQYTSFNDYDYGFGIDKHENTYVTGETQGSNGFFVDKCDSAGNFKWKFAPGSLASNIGGYGNIGVDQWGNVYVTGGFGGSQTFASGITINAIGTGDVFLAKFDSNGVCKWAVNAGSAGYDISGRGVAVDPSGNIYICGGYYGSPAFGAYTAPFAPSGQGAFFIAKYDTSGTAQWVQTASNAGYNNNGYDFWSFNSITVDSCSNVYAIGHFINSATFGNTTLTSNGAFDVFVAKCLANGNWEWAKSAGGSGNDEGEAIVVDKYSDVYVTGYFSGSAQFGTQTVTSSAGTTVFLAKYANSTGDLQWVQAPGGSLSTGGNTLCIDNQNRVYLTGGISNGSGALFGNNNIGGSSGSGQNFFFAKLDTIPVRTITPVPDHQYCPGESTTLPYTVSGDPFNSGNTFTAQLSDSSGSFASTVDIGSLVSNTSGSINITIPGNTPAGTYLIRVVSDSPHTSSWANGCGAYYVNNVYVNDFYITIGGPLGVTLSPNSSHDTICSGSSITLKVTGGTGYTWNNNATIDSIIVHPTADTTYSVHVTNGGCFADTAFHIAVVPATNLVIQPASPVICNGSSIALYTNVTGAFTWSPAIGLSSSTGDTVTVNPTINVTYTVTGNATGGCPATGTDDVSVVPAPNKPTITRVGDVLTSSATQGNQWYVNDTIIGGETNQNYTITKAGCYSVNTINPANGCSATSDTTCAVPTGINQLSAIRSQLSIYPNPTSGTVFITINTTALDVSDWNLNVTDVLGRILYTKASLSYSNEIDLSQLPGGVYFIAISGKSGKAVYPIVRQ